MSNSRFECPWLFKHHIPTAHAIMCVKVDMNFKNSVLKCYGLFIWFSDCGHFQENNDSWKSSSSTGMSLSVHFNTLKMILLVFIGRLHAWAH